MALITCPECGKQISSNASCCPECGCPASVFKKSYEVGHMDKFRDPINRWVAGIDSCGSLFMLANKFADILRQAKRQADDSASYMFG